MDKYRVAKLVAWAGQLKTRKKLQKVVYLLKAAGCQFEADFTLHHYGPYSHELAQLTDDMVRTGLLEEQLEANHVAGKSYSYSLTARASEQLREIDESAKGRAKVVAFERFDKLACKLLEEPVPRLEYAATIAYFKRPGRSWDDARARAAKFKKIAAESVVMEEAEQLARKVMGTGD